MENRARTFEAIRDLQRRSDEDATRELVTLLEDDDKAIALEAARAMHLRSVPRDLRARVGALLETTPAEDNLTRWLYSCAAKAILEEPAELAFAMLAPFLDEHALESTVGRIRAEKILGELEEALASSWAKARQVPDARFLPVCESLSTRASTEELRDLASLIRRAFLVLEGGPPPLSPRNVELGEGDDPPFPFFVAGFPVSRGAAHGSMGRSRMSTCSIISTAATPASTRRSSAWLSRRRRQSLRPTLCGAFAKRGSRTFIDLTVTPDVTTVGVYGEAHDSALLALGLGRPRIVYLWGNSD